MKAFSNSSIDDDIIAIPIIGCGLVEPFEVNKKTKKT
jgi:hypothetical protein